MPTSSHRLWRALLAPAAILTAFALTACGGSVGASGGNAPAGKPASGGTLRLAYDNDPKCVDAQQNGTNNALNISRQLTDSLTDQDPKTGALKPWLATKWSVNKNATSFTFTLRHGVKFHDGAPFNAAAVKLNLLQIQKLGAKAQLASSYLVGMDKVTTQGSDRVTVHFKAPNAQFLQATSSMSLGFYSPATFKLTPEQRCTTGLQGTGPFKLKKYTPGSGAQLVRNDAYDWPSALAKHKGPAYLDGIDFKAVPESSVRTGSLSAGDIDVDQYVQPQDEELLQASKFSIASRPNPGVVYSFYANSTFAPLDDVRVRRALNAGINRSELQALLSRKQSPAKGVLAQSTPGFTDQSKLIAYDPDKARKLLDEAGWKVKPGSDIRTKNGKQLVIDLPYWQSAQFLELVQQQLREIGVDLRLRKTTSAQQLALAGAGKLPLVFANLSRSDPDIIRSVFAATGQNQAHRKAGKIDELFDGSTRETDTAKRYALLNRAGAQLIEGGYEMPLAELTTVAAYSPRVHDFAYEASTRVQLYGTWLSGASAGGAGSNGAKETDQ